MRLMDKAVSEKCLWDWLVLADQFVPGRALHMRRIENLVGAGDPDVSGCYDGGYFDIELKTADRPSNRYTAVIAARDKDPYIRPSQKVWHRLRWAAKGNCFFLVQVGQQMGALRYLIPGSLAQSIEGKPEEWMTLCSVVDPRENAFEFVKAAATYRSTLEK